MKKFLAALVLAVPLVANAQWWNGYQWVSNTCVSQYAYWTFAYQSGPVGTPCSFYYNGFPHYGYWR